MEVDLIKGLIPRNVKESDRRAVAYCMSNDPCNDCRDIDTVYCLTRCNYRAKII